MASFSIVVCNPNKWGLRDSYTLLGAKHFIIHFEKSISCIVLKSLMHIIKIGRSMCVTCLFGVQTLSLLSTRHVLFFQSIAVEVHNINTLVQDKQNQAMQIIETGWFNILDFL
jgi:hypothetical protein